MKIKRGRMMTLKLPTQYVGKLNAFKVTKKYEGTDNQMIEDFINNALSGEYDHLAKDPKDENHKATYSVNQAKLRRFNQYAKDNGYSTGIAFMKDIIDYNYNELYGQKKNKLNIDVPNNKNDKDNLFLGWVKTDNSGDSATDFINKQQNIYETQSELSIKQVLSDTTNSYKPIITDLFRHGSLLIGGAIGSGKTDLVKLLILNIIKKHTDYKTEIDILSEYQENYKVFNSVEYINYLNESQDDILRSYTSEMSNRFRLFRNVKAKDLQSFNEKVSSEENLSKKFLIIDGYKGSEESDNLLLSLIQKCRAAGIVVIFTYVTKPYNEQTDHRLDLRLRANVVNKIALRVNSGVESNIVIGKTGAENLSVYGSFMMNNIITQSHEPIPIYYLQATDKLIEFQLNNQ
ncbi:FtsK/SpoIIIE domain-containing protein [Mammaliicoccus sp. E-M21]|uniref:FtsK/SpoIIIE domain-containing protein n=1 Tax=Mammaliicoccus sp. E-M21 TaxID=2898681 RepID=UPI001EFA6848|nr:FtsK/SpoIIIE domain-containing protein [Mammaliicoccus sp. E-M21]